MATIVDNQDGTATITWGGVEQSILDAQTLDALAQYLTLWLQERSKVSFAEKFGRLSPEDQAAVLAKFSGV